MRRPTPADREAFIAEYIANGGVTYDACKKLNISSSTVYNWKRDPVFQKRLEEVQNIWLEDLRRTALERAKAKSDVLLIFLLKSLRPEIYDDEMRKAAWLAKSLGVTGDNVPQRAILVRDVPAVLEQDPRTAAAAAEGQVVEVEAEVVSASESDGTEGK